MPVAEHSVWIRIGRIMKKLSLVPNLCTGCRECQLMCSLKHAGRFNPAEARIRIEYDVEMNCYSPVICRQCDEPACADACPSEAFSRDDRSGSLVIDAEKCSLCLQCVDACPYGAIRVAPDGTVLKCDLCGGDPECVKFCSKRPEMSSPLMANPEGATALILIENGTPAPAQG
ncbi:MAG: 4Fe-4S dicluster domain-containing protein [Candidatus Abyssobacteria bacterium SURF_5]|uniref:4Fe-4S dicluster domain-containing protein n=1 Tax=Abyssobacteria bacterium (strain SURF_5) TaxID=2093360 RepID=A0A3A4N5C7_ABYX5|nr:MAG: 4Fe-4S dicluster domain-containing protein [Candidatus Abyssubacteria bacterium SURF_5]